MKEAAAEVKATKQWLNEAGTTRFTAPEHTWTGPGRWRGEERASRRENKQALANGRLRYGAAFEQARVRFAGEFTPAEILDACARLEAQGRDRITGRVRPERWYAGYETVPDHQIAEARAAQFEKAFTPQQVNYLSQGYVGANLNGVLWRARAHRPIGSARQEAARGVWVRAQKMWTGWQSARQARRAA